MNQELNGSIFKEKGIRAFIKREDLIFPEIQGNKWRKLKYNLAFARENGFEQVLSFGGAYSNHIVALAAAGKKYGLETIGFIRGEEHLELNPSLKKAMQNGMYLKYISREAYRSYTQNNKWDAVREEYPNAYIIPEGGTNSLAIKGCTEILEPDEKSEFDYFTCPVGTGGTVAGLIASLEGKKSVLGFPALKGNFLQGDISSILKKEDANYTNFDLIGEYHFGGYARYSEELISFINDFYGTYNIPLDPIYTGKMMYGLMDMIRNNYFPEGSSILAIHTGGLQGIAGFNKRHGTQLREE